MSPLRALRFIPWTPVVGITFALALLAGAIQLTRTQLREELRGQLARRDGRLLEALLRQQLAAAPEDAPGDSLTAVLETTRLPQLPGVLSVSLYDTNGQFTAALPATAAETPANRALLAEARRSGVASRFQPAVVLTNEFVLAEFAASGLRPVPVLEVVTTVTEDRNSRLAGYARFLLKGESLAAEFAELDANLERQAMWAFVFAGGAMALVLGFAFQRLARANRRLRHANHELTLAAKTSAVGAVASHLIHGLKNPLAGLQQFVLARDDNPADWSDAAATARRMKGMIDEVVRVLREDSGVSAYEITAAELLEVLEQKVRPLATQRGVRLRTDHKSKAPLPNREANLVLLILENLTTNAVQATSPGGEVNVEVVASAGFLTFSVSDQGTGLPAMIRANLFAPVTSTKAGGTGLGLALSGQLARHLGAELTLTRSDVHGTEFRLAVPLAETFAGQSVPG
jgi:signal transduction histidine kinase